MPDTVRQREQQQQHRPASEPRVLPMPKYRYQEPSQGSFVVRYGEKDEDKAAAKQPDVSLQNLRLAL